MCRLLLSACLLLSLGLPGTTHAAGTRSALTLSSQQCGVGTPYNVLVDSGGIWLRQPGAVPAEIFFHDGELNIDRQPVAVSDADAHRLRQLESGTRQLVPAVAGLAGDVVNIAFDAFAGVVEIMSGSRGKARQVERLRKDAHAYVDSTLGRGIWEQDQFDEGFEQRVEQAAESMSGSLARGMMWSMFTGGARRMEARADRVNADLERKMDIRSKALETNARSLCTQVLALEQLQRALDVRYQGKALTLMTVSGADTEAAREAATDNRIALPTN